MRARLFALVLAFAGVARAQEDPKETARVLFESGVAHFDRGEWSAALADFLRSKEVFPTRSATKNAAICLRKEGRFDEALDTLEELLRTYADLSPADRAFAEAEIASLRGAVGFVDLANGEPGAQIVIDARPRGTYPTAPLRVSAGTHEVRVYKEGFAPIVRRVDVAGRAIVAVDAKLAPLVEGGRLAVTESSGASMDVIVDDVVVGKSPWEGPLAVGHHTIALRGEGDLGTAPVDADVRLRDVARLNLQAVPLEGALRVTATNPPGALLSIDGVNVGHGTWEGKLALGPHRVEVAAEGFVPKREIAVLEKGNRVALAVGLDRDLTSPLWRASHPSRPFVEVDAGVPLGLVYGGDVRAGSANLPAGFAATVRGGYQLSSGLVFAVEAGYLLLSASTHGRAADLAPKGLAPDRGTVDDLLALRGFRIGPSAGYRFEENALRLTVRLGAGLFFGDAVDGRTGTFQTAGGASFPVSVSETSRAVYAYVAPEARASYPIGEHLEITASLALIVLGALDQPTWTDRQPVLAAPAGQQGDGVATFGSQSLAGPFLVVALPSLGARWAF
jgi:hypothetical protein